MRNMALHHQSTDLDMWNAVLARDTRGDGQFVYAVRSTRIYCRPSCPSRRPKRESVVFFSTPSAAEAAGFRACRRCQPKADAKAVPGAEQVRKACAFIEAHLDEPVTLAELARLAGMSTSHLQRTFTRLVGISPRAYQHAVRAARFRRELRDGATIASAQYGAGYGSSSRVYERRPTGPGMTPSSYRRGGVGQRLFFTTAECFLGRLLVAGTEQGLCAVKLGDSDRELEAELRREYPAAEVRRAPLETATWVNAVLAHLEGQTPSHDISLNVHATAFQWRVWRHLQTIPPGSTQSYSEVARAIGHPSAVRAVARACATNQVAIVIPCHRVVQKDGGMAGYRWGVARKAKLIERERRSSKF